MDFYRLTCKGGPGPYVRRARHSHEEDQAQGACRWLPLRGSRDKSQRNRHWSKEKEQCLGDWCHGPGCSRSRRVTGSYGRSTGIEDLVEISREHGRSAVSMETMDSYGLTCKGGPSTAMRRTKLKEQAQPQRGPSSRSMQMVTTQGLKRQEPKELSLIKGEGAVSKESTPGHEEEEQCQRS
ncbi:hypothetical protein NDA10_006303 [Ustilago hordei]|nr:hypothetical protein NDA10_006303 [Ustilago hordei]